MPNFNQLFTAPVRLLAPMEGLTDPLMRQILTQIAYDLGVQYDWTVSEFIRVTHYPVPAHIFYKFVPELHPHLGNNGHTKSGTPVHIQLLGNNSDMLAQSAMTAVTLGAKAIDLNFGCPAKTVNNHKGGAVLLDEPDTIYTIIKTVRGAVPTNVPVSAKIRLGYTNSDKLSDIAGAVVDGGASWLVVHARTKTQGYKPPAYWDKIAPLTKLGIPIIANGEIWTKQHANHCMAQANTPHLMLGRGAVTRPDLIATIKGKSPMDWQTLCCYQGQFLDDTTTNTKGLIGRYKQWLAMLTKGYSEAYPLWQHIKTLKSLDEIKLAVSNNK